MKVYGNCRIPNPSRIENLSGLCIHLCERLSGNNSDSHGFARSLFHRMPSVHKSGKLKSGMQHREKDSAANGELNSKGDCPKTVGQNSRNLGRSIEHNL